MALILLIAVALLLAAMLVASTQKAQEAPVRIRVDDVARQLRRRR